jgi:hypothetical protein
MKRYQPYFNHEKLYEWTSQDNRDYILFEKYANLFLQDRLDEFGEYNENIVYFKLIEEQFKVLDKLNIPYEMDFI